MENISDGMWNKDEKKSFKRKYFYERIYTNSQPTY